MNAEKSLSDSLPVVENPIRLSLIENYTEIIRPCSAPNPTTVFEYTTKEENQIVTTDPSHEGPSGNQPTLENTDLLTNTEVYETQEDSKHLIGFLIGFFLILFTLLIYNLIHYPTFALGFITLFLFLGLITFLYKWKNKSLRRTRVTQDQNASSKIPK